VVVVGKTVADPVVALLEVNWAEQEVVLKEFQDKRELCPD
jgi:hypothetical protein